MADFTFNILKGTILSTINLASDDIRVMLLGTVLVEGTVQDADTISGITIDEITTATNYVRKALASEAVTTDDTNNRGAFDAADVTWTALGGAANDTIEAALIYKHVTNDTDSIPLIHLDLASTPTNGGDITLAFASAGILLAT
jgi:hypothetical protein